MKSGDEGALASMVQGIRTRRGLSQSDLAEAAGVSTKTIQRLEAGKSIAGSSRRAVLTVLDVDPEDLEIGGPDAGKAAEGPWTAVENAGTLLATLASAQSVDIEVDRGGWRRARRERPWYRQDLVFATKDPVDLILDAVDRASELPKLSPGRAAKEQDGFSEAVRAAEAMGWSLATCQDGPGRLLLYIGSPATVAERTGRDAERR